MYAFMKDRVSATHPTATPKSVWAALGETDRLLKESSADFDRRLKESSADFDRQLKESRADFDRRMKKFAETIGAWSNNHGSFAEEYFFNSFESGKQNFFGEKFDEMKKNVQGINTKFMDEYDIVLINGKSIAIIEVKFKAHKDQFFKVLRKAETFRENFPYYANHQIYLGLATLVFSPDLEQECIDNGIAVVKQVGQTVVINDAHLKVF